jgi:hypothetical protein
MTGLRNADPGEDRLQQEVVAAFVVADNIHDESWSQEVRNETTFLDYGTKEVLEDKNN